MADHLQDACMRAFLEEFVPMLDDLDLDDETRERVAQLLVRVMARGVDLTLTEVNANLIERGISAPPFELVDFDPIDPK